VGGLLGDTDDAQSLSGFLHECGGAFVVDVVVHAATPRRAAASASEMLVFDQDVVIDEQWAAEDGCCLDEC
jgi:hypothetical protein